MIFSFSSPGLNTAFSLAYALGETLLMLMFLRPYDRAGVSRLTDLGRVCVALVCALALGACTYTQASMNMLLNTVLHYVVVMLAVLALERMTPAEGLYAALVFHLSTDLSKTLVLDMLPVFSSIKESDRPIDAVLLMGAIMLMQAAALLVLRRAVCHPRSHSLTPQQNALVFFPALPYLYVKYVQYRSYMHGAVLITQEISVMSFGLCLLALCVAVLGERSITAAAERAQAARTQLALERQREAMALHQEKVEEINKLCHDMRNHLSTIAAMSVRQEVRDYIASLEPRLTPVPILPVSGCEALDVLLSRKMDECSRAGASLIPCISAGALEGIKRLSAPDICTIYGNLLDNAIEAVRALPEPGTIILRTNRRGGFLVIRTENPFVGARNPAPDSGFYTTKADADAHGYGMRSVADTVRALGGEMTAYTRDRQFIVNIMLRADP